MICRNCESSIFGNFLDLGYAPPSNAYLSKEDLMKSEKNFPLRVKFCKKCWLVQTEDYALADDLFNAEYAYFSSTSDSWLKHAAEFCKKIITDLQLNNKSMVIEIASNDGYLLKNFKESGIPCLGIEPTASTADISENKGIPVLREFFNKKIAEILAIQGKKADLIIGNNVYAHVPNIKDFTLGLKKLLKKGGTISLEFPHLENLIKNIQFDTIYHEHYSYLSLTVVKKIFESSNLKIIDVEKIKTHGGSLRVLGCHFEDERRSSQMVENILNEEIQSGLQNEKVYIEFQNKADKVKNNLIKYLIELKEDGKKVAGYGAAAKGSTFINYSGIKSDLISFISDASLSKQNKYMPGSHIPILNPEELKKEKPDVIVIFPWNITEEIIEKNKFIREWGGKFVTAIPELRIF